MIQEKHEILHQKKVEKQSLDSEIETLFKKETEKSFVPKIQKKLKIEKIINNIKKTQKAEEILKREEKQDKNKNSYQKKKGSKINISGTGKSEEIRGNFTLKDLEYLDEFEK